MTPEQAKFLLDLELTSLEREQQTTQRVLQAIPPERADYRPETVAKSAFDLAWHIAASEHTFLDAVANGQFTLGWPRPESIHNTADIAAWYGEQMAADRERLRHLSGEELTRIIDFRGVFQMPAVLYVPFSTKHIVHHRGQLSVYLRPMGAKVPAIYGESYDSAEARKAAKG